jgi:hypothetical protein
MHIFQNKILFFRSFITIFIKLLDNDYYCPGESPFLHSGAYSKMFNRYAVNIN